MKLATFRFVDGRWSDPFPDLDSDKTMVIAFAAPSYAERPDLFGALAAAYPRAAVIGCSTSGEIDRTRIRDESITVEKLILQAVAAIGENVIVRRFQRWELGESLNG